MRRALAAGLLASGLTALALAACSAAGSAGAPPDVTPTLVDAAVGTGEDATSDVKQATPAAASLVLVNGLIEGGQAKLDDVRVCIAGRPYALPDAVPMPMSSYPGIPRGAGVDLGLATTTVTLRVFRALDLNADAAWTTRVSCDSWQFSPSSPSTELAVNLVPGPNVAVLVDDPTGTNGLGVRTGMLPAEYAGKKDTLQMVAADFSTFAKAGDTVHVSVEGVALGSGGPGVISTAPFGLPTSSTTLDTVKIRFERTGPDAATGLFEQTLGSVQFLADPTTTPAVYFDQRMNYAFVLLGDATKPVATDARDLQFNGKGLHVVAIPYTVLQ